MSFTLSQHLKLSAMLSRCLANIPMKTTSTFWPVRSLHNSTSISRDVTSAFLRSSSSPLSSQPSTLLQGGAGVQLEQQRGMKVKDKLHRRCKDCYFVYKSGVLHVKCHTHPRHNARNKFVKPQERYILTAVSCTPKKFW